MSARPAGALAVVLVLAQAGAARADDAVCATALADPVAVPWRASGLDGGAGACPRPGASLDVGGHALVDTPAFYGTLGGDATVSLRLARGPIEWAIAARAPTVAFVQNAVLKATEVGYGPLSLAAKLGRDARWRARPLRVALALRAEVPYTERRLGSERAAGALTALASVRFADGWRLHGRAALLGERTWSELGARNRAAGGLSLDVARRVLRRCWFVTAGADLQLGWYGAGLDHLALRAGTQLRLADRWRLAISAGLPVAGAERTDIAFVLGLTRDAR